jgi:hypothetical protein
VRSRAERGAWRPGARLLSAWLLGAWLLGTGFVAHAARAADAPRAAAVPRTAIDDAALDAAVAQVRKDPNVGGEKKTKMLHWISSDKPPPKTATPTAPWILQFFDYLAQTANLLIWGAGILAAGFVGVGIYRLVRARGPRVKSLQAAARATRIGEFDIRPDSLPADVGAAARALLEAGRTREALALLYRGSLSRAVHTYGVPIGEAFTEGEVLRAVDARLDAPRADYFRELVALWQRFVYAGERAGAESVARLCAGFGATLDRTPGVAP